MRGNIQKPQLKILREMLFAEAAVKRAPSTPSCTGGLERNIVNHLHHGCIQKALQELSCYVADSS